MTTTASISAAAGTNNLAPPGADTNENITGDQFMQLLLIELQHQDPLKPMDSNEMMGQITQLNSLQELQAINSGIQSFSKRNNLSDAAALLSKMVSYMTEDSVIETGIVSGITRRADQTNPLIGDDSVPLDNVISVHSVAEEA